MSEIWLIRLAYLPDTVLRGTGQLTNYQASACKSVTCTCAGRTRHGTYSTFEHAAALLEYCWSFVHDSIIRLVKTCRVLADADV
jgi:hypothetical protein